MANVANPTGKHRKKRRHHGEGTVVERKDRWRAKPWAAVIPYTDASGRRKTMWLSASSRDEAEALRRDEVRKLQARILPTDHTVGTYVADWHAAGEWGPATVDRYRQHIEARILPTLGSVRLAMLTPPKVRAAVLSWEGSAATRSQTFTVLRAALRQAVTDRLLPDDPTAGIKAPTVRDEHPVVLDIDEARHLLETVKGERVGPILVTLLGLALRRGECLGLRSKDIKDGEVTINRGLRRIAPALRAPGESSRRLVATKTHNERILPLPAFVAETLAERLAERDREKRAARTWAPNDFVFADDHGNPISFTTLDRWFKNALQRAGLPDMRLHGLRHSTATILLAEGVPEATVQKILGHSSPDMTRKYTKVLARMTRHAADTLDKAVG